MAANCWNGWKWLEWINMAGNDWNGWKWLEIVGNIWKYLEIAVLAGNGWNRFEMAVHRWKWLLVFALGPKHDFI